MVVLFKDLADVNIITILEYLRAVDLVSVSEVNKTIFHKSRISRAIQYQLENTYPITSSPIKEKKGNKNNEDISTNSIEYTCDILYSREIKCIINALNSALPINGGAYWISQYWHTNAKKYFESLNLPDINKKKDTKKTSRIRQRKGSDSLPPWPGINLDLICEHGSLASVRSNKVVKSKKRLIDTKSWLLLRKFYPEGPEYKASTSVDCVVCLENDDQSKAILMEKGEAELRVRRLAYVIGPLEAVALRRSGIPFHLLSQNLIPVSESEWDYLSSVTHPETHAEVSPSFHTEKFQNTGTNIDIIPESLQYLPELLNSTQPLLPGHYNLIPRIWLKSWRNFVKDPKVTSLPPLDCTSMLCHSHGKLVIPPHVEEYLIGVRKGLLNNLNTYPGSKVEILSVEEWDFLQISLKSLSDFSVRFSLDGDNISWNLGVCTACCPFNYGPQR